MDNEEREYLEELRQVHRKNLYRLNLQKAQHSIDVPAILINGIEYEEREIARIEMQLRQGGITNNFYTPKDHILYGPSKIWQYIVGGAALFILGFLLGVFFQSQQNNAASTVLPGFLSTSTNNSSGATSPSDRIGLNQTVKGRLYYNEGNNWVFSDGPATVDIILDTGPYGSSLIILYDSTGVQREYIDAQSDGKARLINYHIPDGSDYIILVRNTKNTEVEYTLTVEAAESPANS
jgi:hypothetical protein